MKSINILVVGAGYVGMSVAAMLVPKYLVKVLEKDNSKIDKINNGISTLNDDEISNLLASNLENISAHVASDNVYDGIDIIFICVPTDYNNEINAFDTSLVENAIKKSREKNSDSLIVIKSTLPIKFLENFTKQYSIKNVIYNPEFLREGSELHDSLNPSRIILGYKEKDVSKEKIELLCEIYAETIKNKDTKYLHMSPTEAEAVKLNSNAYLAMRVAFFNEIDNFCLDNNLSTKNIVTGMSLDPRIGDYYNNPSFGYGGYCLPKDTKQLIESLKGLPNNLIKSIDESNKNRKLFISKKIFDKKIKKIGIYRIVSKSGSDNFRESSIIDIINNLKTYSYDLAIYEPNISEDFFLDIKVEKSLQHFKQNSQMIIANRVDKEIFDVEDKIFSRDIFNTDL
jgi:UDPglucose 6-dehydrogenase